MIGSKESYAIETEQFDYEKRRENDTATWLAEVLPGSMRTPFEYAFDGRELYADDGSPMGPIFDKSIKEAKNLPAYELRRRKIEKQEYQDMIAMAKGDLPNTMIVVSDFPQELMHVEQGVGGYNTDRQQTMLRVITFAGGKISMYSQSLDRSDRMGLEAIYESMSKKAKPGELLGQRIHQNLGEHDQEFLVDKLMGVYDRTLQQKYGGDWYAGQRNAKRLNTYDFVRRQNDLIQAYLRTSTSFSGGDKELSLAAAMTSRYNKYINSKQDAGFTPQATGFGVVAHEIAMAEMRRAGMVARQTGQRFDGCGATVGGDTLGADDQLKEAGYGNKADKLPDDKYGSRTFKCPKKGCLNTRPKNELIPNCQKCGANVRC